MEQKFKDKLMRKRRTNCTMMSRRRRRMPTGARRSVAPGLKWPWWKWVPCMEGEESSSCWWYHTLPCIFSQIIAGGDVSIGRKLNYDYPNDSERGPCKVDPCCVTGWHSGLLKSISWSLTFTSEVCTHPSHPLCVCLELRSRYLVLVVLCPCVWSYSFRLNFTLILFVFQTSALLHWMNIEHEQNLLGGVTFLAPFSHF